MSEYDDMCEMSFYFVYCTDAYVFFKCINSVGVQEHICYPVCLDKEGTYLLLGQLCYNSKERSKIPHMFKGYPSIYLSYYK